MSYLELCFREPFMFDMVRIHTLRFVDNSHWPSESLPRPGRWS
jgi:hypothetical protein